MRDAVAGGWSLTPLAERIDRANHVAGQALAAGCPGVGDGFTVEVGELASAS
jgi:hypothetical protein